MTPIFIPMYSTINTWQEVIILIYLTISIIATLEITGSFLIALLFGWLIFPLVLVMGAIIIICELFRYLINRMNKRK